MIKQSYSSLAVKVMKRFLLFLLFIDLITLTGRSNELKPPINLGADQVSNAVPIERMRQVYDEVKTPFKYGVVIRGETNQVVDCASIFRQNGLWYMVYVGNTKKVGYETLSLIHI